MAAFDPLFSPATGVLLLMDYCNLGAFYTFFKRIKSLKTMFKKLLICAAFLAGLVFACQPVQDDTPETDTTAAELTQEQMVERGHRLVEMLDCNICHSPKVMTDMGPVPDTSRLLSGHPSDLALPPIDKSQIGPGKWALSNNDHFTAWVGPWGISYAANLTPDETGIGNWTIDHFKRAIREGKFKGLPNGRMLLPPMPWQAYNHATDEELEAIFAYLKSIKPVRNVVPAPTPPTDI